MQKLLLTVILFFSCVKFSPTGEQEKSGFTMVKLTGQKSYSMGSDEGYPWENPIHTVQLSYHFYISPYEITQQQYQNLMNVNPSHFVGDSLPVENITWYDAILFCNELSKIENFDTVYTYTSILEGVAGEQCVIESVQIDYNKNGYRLPTEAEWEYACRGNTKTEYYWKKSPQDFAWFHSNSKGKTHTVGQKEPNQFGLYDMCGNVYEWCNDWLLMDYYEMSPKKNPIGPSGEIAYRRVIRGGGFNDDLDHLRSGYRMMCEPFRWGSELGFRVARGSFTPGNVDDEYKMIHIEKNATFTMGSTKGEVWEKPKHPVTLTYEYWLGETEVTQKEFKNVMNINPSRFKHVDRPVENINWFEIILYCNKKSKRHNYDTVYSYSEQIGTPGDSCILLDVKIDLTKNGYRLPTEAEWEYACRGETTTEWYWGDRDKDIDKYAWYYENSNSKSQRVAQKKPNKLGFYDMSGNLFERCHDWWSFDYYEHSPQKNPTGPSTGFLHVLRGGSWGDDLQNTRSAYRVMGEPEGKGNDTGFRLARGSIRN